MAQAGSPPVAAPAAPAMDDGGFTLDLDDTLDVGVEWPDLNDNIPEEVATLPPEAPSDSGAGAPPPADVAATPPLLMEDIAGRDEDIAPASSDTDSDAIADDGSQYRYSIVLTGLNGVADPLFRSRFSGLSVLQEQRGKATNLAQINRRMRLDAELLDRLLRARGYYDAIVRPAVRAPEAGSANKRLRVIFDVRPGERYALSRVALPGLFVAAERVPLLRSAFPVTVGQPVDADAIFAGRDALAIALGENGFPFAQVEEPVVTIDHETRKGDLEMVVRAGGYRKFGAIVVDTLPRRLFSARHLERMARFDPGDVYNASDVEDLRRAIIATSLASSVTVKPVDAGDGEHVNVAVSATPGPMRSITGEIGYGTGEGFRLQGSWQHRNFFPPEGAITASGLLGTKEQAAGLTFRRNNFPKRDHVLSTGLNARHQDLDAFEARTFAFTAGLERQTNILYQKKWVWSVGTELSFSQEKAVFAGSTAQTTRNYYTAALPLSLTYDASDDLLDPHRGFRLGGRLSPELVNQNGSFSYARAQVDGSIYLPVGQSVVVASRVRLGSILGGVTADRIAPSRRFYAGGGASVRGYAYQAIGPRDSNNDPVGGKSLAEFSLEARVRFGTFGVVPFVDAGNISTGFLPKLSQVRYGAGVGLRYYSNFGPIRIDVGTPLNRQRGDGRIAVAVSLGQAF
ncbi:BamA/TamA family outer membrane protein [Sphingobium sp. DEHP117]|uniref:autotransporter assembly complex protein TamA n=1 Tax=Sphingobium sp. DEHP117 TaxID=2993436 RepID=UPI0027D497C1|nr:BamA/TamA family outer membrane protein [Sphingobium sp. DEHP117]MDQ4419373.1 BamA/TamA family outer membrane protein [Sphingobium sp. DEHP117]